MNLAHYIAKRTRNNHAGSFAKTITNLGVACIAVGVFALLISISILDGFKHNIREKIFNFDSHIQLTHFALTSNTDNKPIHISPDILQEFNALGTISQANPFAYAKGIIHANQHVQGVVLKGHGGHNSMQRYEAVLVEGIIPVYNDSLASREIVVSKHIAQQLQVKVNDTIPFYFHKSGKLKPRKLIVVGIYITHLEEFDERVILGDLSMIQQLNNWESHLVGGYEFFIKDYRKLNETAEHIYEIMPYDLQIEKITNKYGYLFDWLNLLDQNVSVFTFILMLLTFLNIIAIMYVLILERTNMIGLLKALGAQDKLVRKIFWHTGLLILFKGLIIANISAFSFCVIQYYFEFIPLNPETYYMNTVPISWNLTKWLLINVRAVFFVSIILSIPTYYITKVAPIKSIKFD